LFFQGKCGDKEPGEESFEMLFKLTVGREPSNSSKRVTGPERVSFYQNAPKTCFYCAPTETVLKNHYVISGL